jgi:hypothetical protein
VSGYNAPQPAYIWLRTMPPLLLSVESVMSKLSCVPAAAALLALALSATSVVAAAPTLGRCPVFPDTAIFNQRIDDPLRFPVHPSSNKWIGSIGRTRKLHADWGTSENAVQSDTYYGIPYNLIDGTSASTLWPTLSYEITDPRDGNGAGVPGESDCAVLKSGAIQIRQGCDTVPLAERRFPFPLDSMLKAEHGRCNDPQRCGDRHVLVLDQGSCRLWESYFAYQVSGRWQAYSTASWDLNSLTMRPAGWTSADAAGLPILPLLARADEAEAGEIRHALRVTFRDGVLDKQAVWPATHVAGNVVKGGIPFGAVLRLRSDFQIPFHWGSQTRALVQAMQRYGLYVADIGSDLYVQGEPSVRWASSTIDQIQGLKMSDFEFVDLRRITDDPRFIPFSYRAAW